MEKTPQAKSVALTPKREKFAVAFVETGNAAEAYRRSFDVKPGTKPDHVHQSASRLLADHKVRSRVDELKAQHAERHNVTVDSLMWELEAARVAALSCETPQVGAAVSATMGKAKLAGLDKQIVQHQGANGDAIVHRIERVILRPGQPTEDADAGA